MRISDWSSDVCSSDLRAGEPGEGAADGAASNRRASESVDRPLPHDGGGDDRRGPRGGSPWLPARRAPAAPPDPVVPIHRPPLPVPRPQQNGRASCRARVCQYVSISGADVPLKNNKQKAKTKSI